MAGFRYAALDNAGKLKRGVLEVDSARQARATLREQGLWALTVDALTTSASSSPERVSRSAVRRRLPAAQLSLLMRQFATLLGAGLTLEQALNALIEQADSQQAREILAGVRGEVLAGQTLARAMENFPRAFPELYRTLVNAGERSGQLAEVMNRLASKVGVAFIYPAIVTVVALCIVVGLLTYVVPQVVGVFQNSNQTLPWLTRALIATSAFLRASGWFWLAGLAGGANMDPKTLPLPVHVGPAAFAQAKVIQSGFADGDNLGQGCAPHQIGHAGLGHAFVVGMYTDAAPEIVVSRGQRMNGLELFQRGANAQRAPNLGLLHGLTNLRQLGL